MSDPTSPDAAPGAALAWQAEVDAAGLLCPLPVLRARKRLIGMAPGQVLRLVATDSAAIVDVPHFCAEAGHTLIGVEETGEGARSYLIRRGQGADRG
ncbi:MAG: sulfurtransferase TusA family protein [Rhodobacteraceae bacterium]|jgi:tRNA 2-thiouridine synthesizing protein A|nr:sulfurtransferase TusA family protein [Paracoccaceae bacterium]